MLAASPSESNRTFLPRYRGSTNGGAAAGRVAARAARLRRGSSNVLWRAMYSPQTLRRPSSSPQRDAGMVSPGRLASAPLRGRSQLSVYLSPPTGHRQASPRLPSRQRYVSPTRFSSSRLSPRRSRFFARGESPLRSSSRHGAGIVSPGRLASSTLNEGSPASDLSPRTGDASPPTRSSLSVSVHRSEHAHSPLRSNREDDGAGSPGRPAFIAERRRQRRAQAAERPPPPPPPPPPPRHGRWRTPRQRLMSGWRAQILWYQTVGGRRAR
eukprot:COSAG01_NODE_3865_length_5614_cov_5.575159_2_plen_269_part_00